MTVVDYIEKKNAILEKHTGLILVPKGQIQEVEFSGELSLFVDMGACPYCSTFYGKDGIETCKDCPMYKANNTCFDGESTYSIMSDASVEGTIVHEDNAWYGELVDLVKEFNDSRTLKDEKMVRKELLENVLNIKIEDFGQEVYNSSYTFLFQGKLHWEDINIYELAYKCKVWAKNQGVTNFNSSIGDDEGLASFHNGFEEYRFEADTEPEAIFKACKWILNK